MSKTHCDCNKQASGESMPCCAHLKILSAWCTQSQAGESEQALDFFFNFDFP